MTRVGRDPGATLTGHTSPLRRLGNPVGLLAGKRRSLSILA